jgi:Bacteriophage head to tail connecting protein
VSTTDSSSDNYSQRSEQESESYVSDLCEQEKRARGALNAKWLKLWEMYKTRPLRTYSDGDWKSNLNDGRIFEVIETVGSYIRNALFFSDNWVELESNEPNLIEVLPLVSTYFRDCLNNSNFKQEFRVYLVQLLLLGFSGMHIYWEDGLQFEAMNAYDLYIESCRRYDNKFSYSFQAHQLNYAEFVSFVDRGLIDTDEPVDKLFQRLLNERDTFDGDEYLRSTISIDSEELVELIEFYDPNDSTLYRIVGCEVLKETSVKECPWLAHTLFETPEDSYGLSIVDSSIGLILENNIMMNRRLDNMAVSVDNMWLFVDDGVTNPDDIKTAPGKVIQVGRPDAITPMRPPSNNFNVTYQEAAVLDTKIDRNIGTGAMISANTYRSGERVTAQEITSVKEAGGNRLSDVYELIENKCVVPMLKRAYSLLKKHTKSPKVVKRPSNRSGVYDYFQMLPDDLTKDYSVRLTATQSIINRDRNIKYLSDFLMLAASVPQFEPFIDYRNLYYDLLVKFGFDDPARYLKSEEPSEEQPTTPVSPMDELMQGATEVGGIPMANSMTEAAAAGRLPELARNALGQTPQTTPTEDDQAQQQAIAAAMQMPLQ